MVVIDRDYLTIPADQIKDIKPVMTILGGRVVFDAAKESSASARLWNKLREKAIRILSLILVLRRPRDAGRACHIRKLEPVGILAKQHYCSGSVFSSPVSIPFTLSSVAGSGPRLSAKALSATRPPASNAGRPKFPSWQRGS